MSANLIENDDLQGKISYLDVGTEALQLDGKTLLHVQLEHAPLVQILLDNV